MKQTLEIDSPQFMKMREAWVAAFTEAVNDPEPRRTLDEASGFTDLELLVPEYMQTPRGVGDRMREKYPAFVNTRGMDVLQKDNTVTRFHFPVDADGLICGPGENDSTPCPPCCPDCG